MVITDKSLKYFNNVGLSSGCVQRLTYNYKNSSSGKSIMLQKRRHRFPSNKFHFKLKKWGV